MCDVCADQLERGDPVCISKQVAQMRSSSERDRQAGAKTLADWAAMDPQFAVPNIVSALETLRLPELISQLLLDSAPQTQAAAARLLAAMLKYPSHAEALQQVLPVRVCTQSVEYDGQQHTRSRVGSLRHPLSHIAGRASRAVDESSPRVELRRQDQCSHRSRWPDNHRGRTSSASLGGRPRHAD